MPIFLELAHHSCIFGLEVQVCRREDQVSRMSKQVEDTVNDSKAKGTGRARPGTQGTSENLPPSVGLLGTAPATGHYPGSEAM